MNQSGIVDINFSPVVQFTLPDEDHRPVFVQTTSIVPGNGSIASRDARVSQEFSRVTELRSDLMSESRQLLPNVLRHKRFDVHVTSLECSFREPSGFKSFLDVETEVGDVGHELRMRLRLIKASHDAETDTDTILFHKRGNDRVQRAFSRRERIRVISFQRK